LKAAPEVHSHLLIDLPHVKEKTFQESEGNEDEESEESTAARCPMIFVDTAGCGLHEEVVENDDDNSDSSKGKLSKGRGFGEGSKANEGEVSIVLQLVKRLLAIGLRAEEIGVIAPYNAQVDRLRLRLRSELPPSAQSDKLEISTVDGFQARQMLILV
jgi:superfamily I DNA and/or RNA helicase